MTTAEHGAVAPAPVSLARARAARPDPRPGAEVRRALAAYTLMSPAILLMVVMLVGPLVCLAALSLTDYQLGARAFAFIGLGNFRALLHDPVFWKSLGNTLFYAALVTPGSVGLGLVAALLIESGAGLKGFYRAALFLPAMATFIAMAITWEFMLHPMFGLVNLCLGAVGIDPVNWLQNRATALPTLAVIGIWQQFGFNMVLILAGLVSIPKYLYEAAALDGASGGWERFRLVTWPMLGPVMVFTTLISGIRAFQVFDIVQALTQGGPNKATEVLLHTMYAEGFQFFRTGYASAITIVFVALVMALTLAKNVLWDNRGRCA